MQGIPHTCVYSVWSVRFGMQNVGKRCNKSSILKVILLCVFILETHYDLLSFSRDAKHFDLHRTARGCDEKSCDKLTIGVKPFFHVGLVSLDISLKCVIILMLT